MSMSTRNAPPSDPAAACAPFSGLGQAMRAIKVQALSYRPRWREEPAAKRPVPQPTGAYGYSLLCRLCRETRAG